MILSRPSRNIYQFQLDFYFVFRVNSGFPTVPLIEIEEKHRATMTGPETGKCARSSYVRTRARHFRQHRPQGLTEYLFRKQLWHSGDNPWTPKRSTSRKDWWILLRTGAKAVDTALNFVQCICSLSLTTLTEKGITHLKPANRMSVWTAITAKLSARNLPSTLWRLPELQWRWTSTLPYPWAEGWLW